MISFYKSNYFIRIMIITIYLFYDHKICISFHYVNCAKEPVCPGVHTAKQMGQESRIKSLIRSGFLQAWAHKVYRSFWKFENGNGQHFFPSRNLFALVVSFECVPPAPLKRVAEMICSIFTTQYRGGFSVTRFRQNLLHRLLFDIIRVGAQPTRFVNFRRVVVNQCPKNANVLEVSYDK